MPSAIPILFGTESGNAEYCADALARALNDHGISATSVDMERFDLVRLEREPVIVFISSTYGNGDPPYNATKLLEHLQTSGRNYADLHFAVCGLGDSTFEYFAKCGKDFQAALLESGATEMVERADCDVDFDDDFEAFRDRVVAYLQANPQVRESDAVVEAAEPSPEAAPRRVFEAALLERVRLSGPGSNKRTVHYVFDVSGAHARYDVGDCFAVHPSNGARLVQAVVDALGCTAALPVQWRGSVLPLADVLEQACLQHVEAQLVERVAALPGESSRPAAVAVREGTVKAYRADNHVLDVLLDNAARELPPQALVDGLRKLQPRMYSVASSSASDPGRVAFTIETVRYQRRGRVVEGVASCQLSERLSIGETVPMHLVPNAGFHFEETGAPVIMVGPGTGVAPFRGYLEHLEATGHERPTWLFFGHQREGTDFLYREDIMAWLGSGVLDRVSFAWSRSQPEKVYVQHKLVEHGAEVWAWLERGASLYVCGDASGMEPGVAAALRTVAHVHGGQADPERWFASLVDAGRYKTDVY